MENLKPSCCVATEGNLPGKCASLVFPYVPMQCNNPERYDEREGLTAGTLFPGLNLPFFKTMKTRMNCDNKALCELMSLGFALTELGLYLDTHKDDREVLRLYREYAELADEGRKRYEAMYGPLQMKTTSADKETWNWVDGPWPWEFEGGRK